LKDRQLKKIFKKFKKTLDKLKGLWYNEYRKREEIKNMRDPPMN